MTTRIEIACTVRSRLRGLLGRDSFNAALLIVPCRDIHTYGMRKAIDVAFVSKEGLALKVVRGLTPRKRVRCKGSAAVIERFAIDGDWFQEGDRLCLCKVTLNDKRRRGE